MRLLLTLVGVSLLGCTFDDLDHVGKTCPCADGYACYWETNTCEKPSGGCNTLVGANEFRVAWTTPNSIAWRWNALGNGKDFGAYRLHYGPGTSPSPASEVVLSSEQNPELGLWEVLDTGNRELIELTLAQELVADTSYWAWLEVEDATGCKYDSPVVSAKTDRAPPADQQALVVFDEEVPAGVWKSPLEAVVKSDENAYEGSSYLEWISPGTSGENIQFTDLNHPLSGVGENIERSAFLEFAVSWQATSSSYYARTYISGGHTAEGRVARLEFFTLKNDGQYHLFQIPLSALTFDDGGPPFTGEDYFRTFAVGCSPCFKDAVIRLDEIRLRW